jgi:hypothetical protein
VRPQHLDPQPVIDLDNVPYLDSLPKDGLALAFKGRSESDIMQKRYCVLLSSDALGLEVRIFRADAAVPSRG